MREEILDQVPSLGSLYRRAVARTARAAAPSMISGDRTPTSVPDLRYTVPEVAVDADHLADYQHLLGEPGTDVLPAGYVHVLGFPLAMQVMVREDFPLPVLGMVHVANRVEQFHPLQLTDTLRVRAWAQGLRAHRSGTQVDLVVEVSGQDGLEVAWRGVSTYLAKGTWVPGLALVEPAGSGGSGAGGFSDLAEELGFPSRAGDGGSGGGSDNGGSGGGPGDRESSDESGGRTDEDDGAGTPGELTWPEETATWRFSPRTTRRYATVSGDRNPIHMSRLAAKAFGFRRSIAHGMDSASRALAAVGTARGSAFTWRVDFAKPVLLPSQVSFGQRRTEAGSYLLAGWKPGTDRVHFTGVVRPLP